jgi:DNA-binding transcriptional MocR family regulator
MFRQGLRLGMIRSITHKSNAIPTATVTTMTSSESKKPIDFFTGWPNPGLLPPNTLNAAANSLLSDSSQAPSILRYGEDEGYLPLRKEVAKWLTTFYRPEHGINYKRICITGGASQNLACVLQTFTDPVYTRNVWMVSPTYFLACRIFDDSGFAGRFRAVPEDEEGIDIDFLEQQIKASEGRAQAAGNLSPRFKPVRPWRKIYKHVIYGVPTFANPSGRVTSLRRRESLVRLARRYDALIITDDVYDFLQWSSSSSSSDKALDSARQPRMVDVDRYLDGGPIDDFGNAVSNGSFSKIVAPGCRTGWAEGTESLAYGLSQTGSSRSGGCPSHLVASFISQMLASNTLQDHIEYKLKPAYARRYHNLMGAINAHLLPLGLTMPEPGKDVAGGYFVWLELPKPLVADRVTKLASREEGLIISEGPKYQVVGDEEATSRFERNIRLCFAYADEDSLEEGVKRLARVISRELKAEQ